MLKKIGLICLGAIVSLIICGALVSFAHVPSMAAAIVWLVSLGGIAAVVVHFGKKR